MQEPERFFPCISSLAIHLQMDVDAVCPLEKRLPNPVSLLKKYTVIYHIQHCDATLFSPQMENIMGCLNHFMQQIQQYITIIYLWTMFVHSPPDRPHLIMLFCFLISRNAKCLCHLWTAKRANLGFSLIATVTSLLRLHRGGGWVGMHGRRRTGGRRDGRMKTQLSSHTAEVWKNAAGQQNAAWRSPTAGSGGTACAVKEPQHPTERGEDTAPASSARSTLMGRWLY